MTIDIQLGSFFTFFLFGILLGIMDSTLLKKRQILNYIVVPALTLLFMYVLYHVNGGKIHPYFIAVFLLGITFSKVVVKFIKKFILSLKSKIKK